MQLANQDDVRDFDAAQKMRSLYAQLETVLKRHRPREYALFASGQLSTAFESNGLAQIRPHHLLHSIEANCAYARGQNRDPVNRNRIARVMNIYHGHEDPLHAGLLADEKVDLFFLALYCEQMEFQHTHSTDELARNHRPLIQIDDSEYLAPHPPLILRHSGRGLYSSVKHLPSFGPDFGASVQRYVGKVLECASEKIHLFCDAELENLSPGKSCDFLLELADAVVLVESKATSFVAERLVENAILNDGSTTKIATAIEQLYTTARDLQLGTFDGLGIDSAKPVV